MTDHADVDVLAMIDGAVEDWTVSQDAMRWQPVWDEPIVRSPRGPIEKLAAQGWDGYAASAYVDAASLRMMRGYKRAMDQIGAALTQQAMTFVKVAKQIDAL